MLIKDQYDMITPEKKYFLPEYESFYASIGQIFKMSIIENKVFHEIKASLPAYFLEISQNSTNEEKSTDAYLMAIGLQRQIGKREEFLRDISDSSYIQKYFDSDLGKYIDFYSNYQQFLLIYANFEGTIHSFLERKNIIAKKIRQSNLIEVILELNNNFINKFNELTGNNFDKNDFSNHWNYYTYIRNLYVHKFAIIDNFFIENINKIKLYFEDVNNKLVIENSILNTEDFFQLNEIKLEQVFAISDSNMRCFREFLINLWETIYCLENPACKGPYASNLSFIPKRFSFKIYDKYEQHMSMQTMPLSLTETLDHFQPSGYICPICKKNDFFLFKTKFASIDLDSFFSFRSQSQNGEKIVHKASNAFTCPFCKSFFFPEYQKKLSKNTGFNLLNLSSREYLNALEMIQEIAKEGIYENNNLC